MIFCIVNKIKIELKFIISLIEINHKWKGIIPNLIKIEILIKNKKNSICIILYWNAERKNKEDEKAWTTKYVIIAFKFFNL